MVAPIIQNSCSKCRMLGYPICIGICKQMGGGSGGALGGSNDSDSAKLKETSKDTKAPSMKGVTTIDEFESYKNRWLNTELNNTSVAGINYDAGLFSVSIDRLNNNFSLRLKSNPSKEEVAFAKEYLQLIKNEFEAFTGKSYDNPRQDNELMFHFESAQSCCKFIDNLARKNLLAVPSEQQYAAMQASPSTQENTAPTPLKTRPSPYPKNI